MGSLITKALAALCAALLIALLAGIAWHQHTTASLGRQLRHAQDDAAAQRDLAERQAVERGKEAAIHAKQQEAIDAAATSLAQARADAAGARSALDRLRERAALHAAAARPPGPDPALVGVCQTATVPADLLADVLSRAADRAQQLAAFADESRAAGLACQRSYEAVRQALSPPASAGP